MTIEKLFDSARSAYGRLRVTAAAAAVLAALCSAPPAWAVCGDAEIDVGEMCDDGNLADGDCCTSSCQRPGGCYVTNRSGLRVLDRGDDRDDKLFWRYFRGESTFTEWGDPTVDTTYAFCIWDDDELKFDTRVLPGGICYPRQPCWNVLGRGEPQAYDYFNKPTNEWGIQNLRVSTEKPPLNAYISLRGIGVNMPLPGPVAFDQYFNQTTGVTVQLLRGDSPVCWEATFPTSHQNLYKRFRAILNAP